MIKTLLTRLQNKKVLVSLFAGIVLILTNTGVIDVTGSHTLEVTFNTVLGILVALGVVTDPESHVPVDQDSEG